MPANRVLGLFALLILLAGAAIGASFYFGRTEVVAPPDATVGARGDAAVEKGDVPAPGATGAVDGGGEGALREAVAAAGDTAGPAIIGRLVNESGQPVADAEVRCAPGNGLGFDVQEFDPTAEDAFDPQAMTERLRSAQQQQVSVRSDGEGRFKIVPATTNRSVSVQVMARGYQVLQQRAARPTAADVDLGVLTVQAGAVVTGRVLDPRGNPIAAARVMRMQQFEAGFDFDVQMPGMDVWENVRGGDAATTDELGRFELPHLAAGEFTLRARHPDHPSARSEALNVPKGRSVKGVLITMSPGADIRGVVLNVPENVKNVRVMASAKREPVAGADGGPAGLFNMIGGDPTELLGDMGMSFGERQVDLDGEGRFVLRGLEQGMTYRLWAVQQGRGFVSGGQCTERLEVRSGTSNVELHYEAGVTVTFTVLGKGDAPVERLWVRDRLRGGANGGFGDIMQWGGGGGGGSRGRAANYPEGRVTLANLRPKQGQKLQLDVDALGHLGWQKADIELPSVGQLDLGTVRLSPTPVLEVEVVAADTEAPIAGARVRLSAQQQGGDGGGRNPFAALQGRFGGQGPSSATTDAAGRAAVNAVVDGPGTLRITAKDFAPARLELPANTAGAQRISLLVGGTIEVSVLDPQQRPVANVTVEHRTADGETDEQRTDEQRTNEQGLARFAHQVPGAHEVRLAPDSGPMRFAMRLEGMQQLGGGAGDEPWTAVAVEDKATAQLTLAKAPTAKIEGVVRENGLPLAGARVSFVEGPGAGGADPQAAALGMVQGMMEQLGQGGGKSARSGDDGAFSLAELPSGQHRLRITHKDRAMPTEIAVLLREGDNRVDADLDMTSLRGVVRDPDGNPISGARVSVKTATGDGNQPDVGVMVESMAPGMNLGGGRGSQRTDDNGAFELRGVDPGVELQIRATARGFAAATTTATASRGESKTGIDLRLGAAGKIAVSVAGAAGPFAMVSARRVGDNGPQGQPAVQMLRRGKGTIADLEPGIYEVEYRSMQDMQNQQNGGGGQKKQVEVKAGETVTVEF